MPKPEPYTEEQVISARHISPTRWDSVLIVDGKMESVSSGGSLTEAVTSDIASVLVRNYLPGTRVVIRMSIEQPGEPDAQNAG